MEYLAPQAEVSVPSVQNITLANSVCNANAFVEYVALSPSSVVDFVAPVSVVLRLSSSTLRHGRSASAVVVIRGSHADGAAPVVEHSTSSVGCIVPHGLGEALSKTKNPCRRCHLHHGAS